MDVFIADIDEVMIFTKSEQELLSSSVAAFAKLRIADHAPMKTVFTIMAPTRGDLDKARYLLGRCVVYIHGSRQNNNE